MNENIKRVVIYARVSSEGQRKKGTIESQLAECTRFADRQGWEIAETFREEAVSGTLGLDRRPILRACLDRLEKGDIDGLLVWESSRRTLPYAPMKELDDMVFHYLIRCLADPGLLKEMADTSLSETREEALTREIDNAQRLARRLESKRDRLLDLYGDGLIDQESLYNKVTDLEGRLATPRTLTQWVTDEAQRMQKQPCENTVDDEDAATRTRCRIREGIP